MPAPALPPRNVLRALWFTAALTLALWLIPLGNLLGRPLLWLSSFAHESGHGLAAILVGGRFDSLELWMDGSGVARNTHPSSAFADAVVSAGGLLGPAVLAAALFGVAASRRLSRFALLALGLAMAAAALLVVRSGFGLVFTVPTALLFLALGFSLRPAQAQIAVLFVAVQMALSVFSSSDYLFARTASTGAGQMPSDVANMASALGGPWFVWGAVVGLFSLLVLIAGLAAFTAIARFAERPPRPAAPRRRLNPR